MGDVTMPDVTDVELVARAQGGEVDAAGSLYDRHRESVFRYLWLRLGDQQLAEDLSGDVFTRMLDALPRYQALGIPFRAWLYRIAHNLLIDHFRKTSQRASVPLDVLEDRDDGNDPTLVVEGNLLTEQLMRALSHLDHNQREVVTLRFLMGLSLQEVAQAMDKSEAAVKSLQHRGLTLLRRALHPVEEQVA